jgi:hypothetical protein
LSSPQVVRKLTLYSCLPLATLYQQLDAGVVSNPPDKAGLQALWVPASQSYATVGTSSRSYALASDVQPLQGVGPQKVQNTVSRMRLYSPFDTHGFDIYDVNIGKLVTPQISINTVRATSRASIMQNMTNDQLFDVCFNAGAQPPPINRQVISQQASNQVSAGSLMFTSYNEDVRPYPPMFANVSSNPNDPQANLVEAACLPVGGGSPFAWAFRVKIDSTNTRLYLCNAIHRVYALAQAGYTTCPLAVVDLNVSEFPLQLVDLPRDFLTDANRNPPLMIDYLNPSVVVPLDYYLMLTTVRINWQSEKYTTVLR